MVQPGFKSELRHREAITWTIISCYKQLVDFRMFVWVCIYVFASAGRCVTSGHVMTGQPYEVLVNSSQVLSVARFAVGEFNRANAEDHFAYKIVNITSAKLQMVAGINYILEMQLGRTVCNRSDTVDSEPCVFNSEPKELRCHFIVTEIPWRDLRTLTQKKCHPPKN